MLFETRNEMSSQYYEKFFDFLVGKINDQRLSSCFAEITVTF